MACYAVIPIKARAFCKTRLSSALGPALRRRLASRMLDHVISAAQSAASIEAVVVLSQERDTVPDDIPVVHDDGTDLNLALEIARRFVLAAGASELVVLPADLPLLRPADIDRLVCIGRRAGVAVAPDMDLRGTNALFLASLAPFRFYFGSGSLRHHEAEAVRCGFEPQRVIADGFAVDVDTFGDVRRSLQLGGLSFVPRSTVVVDA